MSDSCDCFQLRRQDTALRGAALRATPSLAAADRTTKFALELRYRVRALPQLRIVKFRHDGRERRARAADRSWAPAGVVYGCKALVMATLDELLPAD